jgi:DMSO reductase family type II enzyme heme b subunit
MQGKGAWENGVWTVVFVRDLKPAEATDVIFKPGAELCFALAVWDGQARDRNGQISVTVWHCLTLEK